MLYEKLTIDFISRVGSIKQTKNKQTAIYCPMEEMVQFVILDQDPKIEPVIVRNQFGMALDSRLKSGIVLISQDVVSYFPRSVFEIICDNIRKRDMDN